MPSLEPDSQVRLKDCPELLDVRLVTAVLTCSQRTVYRLSDAGRMPRPIKLGALVRWRRDELEAWIAAGCPICKVARNGAGR